MVSAITEIKEKLDKKHHPVTIGLKRQKNESEDEENFDTNEAKQIKLTSNGHTQDQSVFSSHCYNTISNVDYDFYQYS